MTDGSHSSGDGRPREIPGLSEGVLTTIEAHLRQRELRREELYQKSRRLRRMAQTTMSRLHVDHRAETELLTVRNTLEELSDWLRSEGRGDEPIALDALQEAVEATLLGAIVTRSPLPGPAELRVEPEPYLLGLGDVIGEVRRLVLDRLAHEDLPAAVAYLALMETLTQSLLRFDTTRAIVQLKPKQDAARSLLERTRGDVVMARYLVRIPASGGPP